MGGTVKRYYAPIKLYKHQVDAARQIMEQGGIGLLHMEMGTGKTLSALSIAGALAVRDKIDQVWIFCTKSAISVWENELKNFGLDYDLTVQMEHKETRQAPFYREYVAIDTPLTIHIITYDMAWRRTQMLESLTSRTLVICDEVQKIKSPSSKRSRFLYRVGQRVDYRVGLSGTPAPKGPFDYYAIFRFIDPKIFGTNYSRFKATYGDWAPYPQHWLMYRFKNLDELKRLVQTHTYSIQKTECLDLPKKTRQIINVSLSQMETEIYDKLEKEFVALVEGESERTGLPVERVVMADHVLPRLLRLAEVTAGFTRTPSGETIWVGESKLNALVEHIEPLLEAGERVVVFARFRPEIEAISEALKDSSLSNGKQVGLGTITGSDSTDDRREAIETFINGTSQVLICSLAAASESIDLSASAYTFFFSIDYDLSHVEQADARNDRIGQTRPMTTYFLQAGGTVDEYMYQAVVDKRQMQDWIGGFIKSRYE
jgi:SNF2 family DNA or RNA helicase